MIYRSDTFEIDTDRGELRRGGTVVPLEPQTYRLLVLLAENHDQLVSKDEIIEGIWGGRVIADAAITTCIKQVRAAIGDNGREQKYIKTYSKRGFRFIGPITPDRGFSRSAKTLTDEARNPLDEKFQFQSEGRPSIAVLPFHCLGDTGNTMGATLGDALAHELIAELARSNWLFVVARASTFQFRSEVADLDKVRQSLDAKYCVTGEITYSQNEVHIFVELTHTQSGAVVWANAYDSTRDAIHEVRTDIKSHILSSLERRIMSTEIQQAKLNSPENLDAWSYYHLGLHHFFRFTEAEALVASKYFTKAIEREPTFARAHAGLSATHFVRAQIERESGNTESLKLARATAEKAVEIDPLDPFANFSLGGVAFLGGDLEEAITWTDRAITVNPNYAHAISARAWHGIACGSGKKEQELADLAMKLSPLDPLYYGMQVARAMSHIVRDEFDEAVAWAGKAATAPQPSPFLGIVVVMSHELSGNHEEARRHAAAFKELNPGIDHTVFFKAFPFRSEKHQVMISEALSKHGL